MDKMQPLLPSMKWGKKRTGGAKLFIGALGRNSWIVQVVGI
jgi:hypothetical protein